MNQQVAENEKKIKKKKLKQQLRKKQVYKL